MKKTIIITLLTALTACSGPLIKYQKDGHDQSDWDRDFYDCKAKNRTAHPAMMLIDAQNAMECMTMEKGWRRAD